MGQITPPVDNLLDRIAASDANTSQWRISVELTAIWATRPDRGIGRLAEISRQKSRRVGVQITRPVGREAATKKYDILSALLAYGLSQDKHRQRLIVRLMALITTRYNWQRDELTMGQAEIAKLWSVDTRTVKREMAKLRASGWLVEKRAAARGRVAVHGIALDQIMLDTKPMWEAIGPDFVARVAPEAPVEGQGGNVVPLRPSAAPVSDGSLWAEAQAVFHGQDPAGYAAWVEKLVVADVAEGVVHLVAPSRFHARYVATNLVERLAVILRRIDPSVRKVEVTG